MSRETNEGVMMRCKKITANLLTILHLLVEHITPLEKPKASLEAYISIRQPTCTVIYSNPVISLSLYSFFYFGSMLRSNIYWWSTVESYVGNSAGHRGGINTTVKTRLTASRNCIYIIYLIKGSYVLCWGPSISWKSIVE